MNDRISTLLDASHGLDRAALAEVSAEDLSELRSIVGDRATPRRARALELYAALRPPDVADVLGGVVVDAGEDPAVRAASATLVGRTGGAAAEAMLLAALDAAADDLVRLKVIGALARVGTPRALDRIEAATRDPSPRVRQQAAFAAAVIAHRTGTPGFEPPAPRAPDLRRVPPRAVPFEATAVTARILNPIVPAVEADAYGIKLSPRQGLMLTCGPVVLTVLLEAERVATAPATAVLERPTLAGVVARRAPVDGSFSVWRVMLAGPRAGGGYVALYRSDGTMTHYAAAKGTDAADLEVNLRSVALPGNVAVDFQLAVQDNRLTVTTAASAPSSQGVQPRAIDTPPPGRIG